MIACLVMFAALDGIKVEMIGSSSNSAVSVGKSIHQGHFEKPPVEEMASVVPSDSSILDSISIFNSFTFLYLECLKTRELSTSRPEGLIQ